MNYSVDNIFTSALQTFSGVTRNNFNSPNQLVFKALEEVRNEVDILESKRVVPLLPALYGGEVLYPLPPDVDFITDITPYDQSESNIGLGNKRTDLTSHFYIDYVNGIKLLRVKDGLPFFRQDPPLVLNQMDDLVGNGTVIVSSDATNLDLNTIFYLQGKASLDFDIIASSGHASLEVNNFTAVDIENYSRDAIFNVGIFFPEELVDNVTNIVLKIGSDNSNYFEMTVSKTAYDSAFIEGFNVLRFEKRNATENGTVDEQNISYLEVRINHTLPNSTEVKGVKIDVVSIHKGQGYKLEYYSDWFFRNPSNNARLRMPSSVGLSDIVEVDRTVFNLIVKELEKIMDMALRGQQGGAVWQQANRTLYGVYGDFKNLGLYEKYKRDHPSEKRVVSTSYL